MLSEESKHIAAEDTRSQRIVVVLPWENDRKDKVCLLSPWKQIHFKTLKDFYDDFSGADWVEIGLEWSEQNGIVSKWQSK